MKLTQGREAGELPVEELLQVVVLQVEHLRPGRAFQAERFNRDDVAVVQENLDVIDVVQWTQVRSARSCHFYVVVLGGVHGDEGGHVGVVAGRASDLVPRPLRVVEAGAVVRALHAKKSQQKQSGWQWAEYSQSNSELGIETRGALEDEHTTELWSPIVGVKPPHRPGFFAGLLIHEREQSQVQGLSASKSLSV